MKYIRSATLQYKINQNIAQESNIIKKYTRIFSIKYKILMKEAYYTIEELLQESESFS